MNEVYNYSLSLILTLRMCYMLSSLCTVLIALNLTILFNDVSEKGQSTIFTTSTVPVIHDVKSHEQAFDIDRSFPSNGRLYLMVFSRLIALIPHFSFINSVPSLIFPLVKDLQIFLVYELFSLAVCSIQILLTLTFLL